MNGFQNAVFKFLVIQAHRRLERAYHIAHHIFRPIMQQSRQPPLARQCGLKMQSQSLHQHAMLGDGKSMISMRLPIPPRHTRQPMRNVGNFNVER